LAFALQLRKKHGKNLSQGRFVYLRQIFPKISESKMREGIFIGAQIKQPFADHDFSTKLNATQKQPERHLKTFAETF
jgi:hypothetical protein